LFSETKREGVIGNEESRTAPHSFGDSSFRIILGHVALDRFSK